MTPQEITKMVERNGIVQTIAILFLIAAFGLAMTFLREYKADKDDRRQEAEEKRKLDVEMNQNYIKMIEKITATLSQNSFRMEDFKKKIEEHQTYSVDSFNSITSDLQEIKTYLSAVSDMSDKLATKEGLREVKEKVEDLIKALE